jgi:hypothetical protein
VLEPLCGERLIWDFGAGRFLTRSAPPGTAAEQVDKMTLTLAGGARARVLATERGTLTVAVEHAEDIAKSCGGNADQVYSASVNDGDSQHDPVGLSYESARTGETSPVEQTLPLSGRVVLGRSVQLGAGWGMEGAALLESGTVTMRVVPWAGDERITLRIESLDEGGILDTSPCGKPDDAQRAKNCQWRDAVPAHGFLRARDGAMTVQLYTPGPVSVQAFGGREHLLEISAFTAAVHSTPIQALVSMLVTFAALWSGLKTIFRDLGWFADTRDDGQTTEEQARQPVQAAAREEQRRKAASPGSARGRSGALSVCLLACVGLVSGGIVSSARAEPVEVHQADHVGSGNSFRRGASCLVLTAHHVVPETGVPITVFDRSGAKAEGTRSYGNDAYDVALVTLPDDPPIACTTPWPDASWMTGASFTPKSEFYATIHHADGRESIVRLTYAGGIKHLLTLAPADKFRVIASDSGSLVVFDDKAAGIVQAVDESADRVNVIRFDMIDQLVGDRFRGSAAAVAGALGYDGVLWHGQPNPNWSTYVQAWLTEKAGRTVYATKGDVPVPPGACSLKVEVLSWDRVPVNNPQYDAAQQALKVCNKKGFLYEAMCTQARTTAANTPRQLVSQKLALNVTVTPPGGTALTKLNSSSFTPAGATLSQAEIELNSLQTAAAGPIKELLDRGGCK